MRTLTPTSEAQAAGLPDLGLLNQLAGEFFAALPGDAAALAPSAPAGPAPAPGVTPSLGAVPAAPAAAPASPRPALSLGVPVDYAPSLPSVPSHLPQAVPHAPQGAPTPPGSPFYFLAEAGSQAAATPARAALPVDDRVTAQAFGLPGADALRALLSDGHPSPAPAATPPRDTWFYFADPAGPNRHAGAASPQAKSAPFDVNAVRRDFPILAERVNGKPLVWLDNAATTHKPQSVIDRIAYFYAHENSNIHRAAHELAARATDAYEAARQKVARFLGASSTDEIIFVRGATEAINLVARTWGQANIQAGDEIVVSHLEHHANIVPWQMLAAEKGAKLRVIPVDDTGQILLEEARRLMNDRTKLVAVTQVSNALGTVTPVRELVALAHSVGAKALVDGAQAVSHLRVDVQALDADFYVFSGHKVFAPTGIGVVYGKRALLEHMPPYQGGGNMIADVTFERTVYQGPPNRFEAGTGNIADAVGLGAAIDYVQGLGLEAIAQYEHDLLDYTTHGLKGIPGLRLVGTAAHKASVASFVLPGWRTEEIGAELNREGIAVRSGHHCAQPILRRFGLEATVRPSLAFYNTCEEVDLLVRVVNRLARSRR